MKTFNIIIALTLLFSSLAYSQDIITQKDGKEIEAKVLEITDNEIKYKKHSNIDGPTYTVVKEKVLFVKYVNGEKEMFSTSEAKSSKNNQLRYKKGFKTKYYLGEKRIDKSEFLSTLSTIPNADKKFKSGKTLRTVGLVTMSASALYLITTMSINAASPSYTNVPTSYAGSPYGGSIGYTSVQDPIIDSTTLIASSIGLVGGTVLNIIGSANMKGAVKKYNNNKVVLNYQIMPNGVGITMNF